MKPKWIKGTPKTAIACEWDMGRKFRACGSVNLFTEEQCQFAMHIKFPCYRHRPIKEEK